MSITPSTRKTTYFHDPFALDPFPQFHHLGAPFSPPGPPRPHRTSETAASTLTTARVEWTRTPTAHVFKLDLPGVKREEVTIDLEDGRVLKITSEKRHEKEDRSDWWHRVERSEGRFVMSFVLPENCKPHESEASMENGVLTIKVPKLELRNGRGGSVRIAVR
ncbi:18.1 kDa class I heat shock protein-like isoform X2 [Rhodamnia argentea]|uniref:18.1 kDa class I heat shock protein-like isoform X2 n=1 Tax=Rhodamnia argentea TaxID=178133 RepID=A0ABM3HNY9_9MYRT|nr:18.1 kDa class I heat shock protein-like isoform X2 [Rhodamnia argentea]